MAISGMMQAEYESNLFVLKDAASSELPVHLVLKYSCSVYDDEKFKLPK